MMAFADWLMTEIRARGWTEAEFARRGKVTASAVNQIINQQTRPGAKLCRAAARAFDLPLEDVMRRAGLLEQKIDLPDAAQMWGARLLALEPETRHRTVEVMDAVLRTFERGA